VAVTAEDSDGQDETLGGTATAEPDRTLTGGGSPCRNTVDVAASSVVAPNKTEGSGPKEDIAVMTFYQEVTTRRC